MDTGTPIKSEAYLQETIQRLESTVKELQKKNQELESFAYVASHDLREPLRKIHIFSERILETEAANFSPLAADHFRRILSATERMKKLIDALLNYSRTNTDEKIFVKQDLNQLLEEVKQDLQESIIEKNATLLSDELPTLKLIPHQFLQLLENLIGNSLKYRKADVAPVIKIGAKKIHREEGEEDNRYWQLTVSDNGIGFEEEYKERIFELFQRLHGKHEYEGTGIGLSICKKIVENHNGTIYAESALGEGCTITILLPIGDE